MREIHSHPVALDQCRRLISSLPDALAVAAPTTGDAATIVAKLADPTIVAIASDRAARINGLTIIDANVGDHPEAFTRFVSVAPYTRLDRRDGGWRTAFSFTTDHRPGALFHALEPLSRHAIDLNLLVSRPIPSRPFSYRFDAVLSGHPLDPEISATLREMKDLTAELRVFGSYRADHEGGDRGPHRLTPPQAACDTLSQAECDVRRAATARRAGQAAACDERPQAAAGSACSSEGRYWCQLSGTRCAARRMKSTGAGARGGRGSDIDASSSRRSPLRRLHGAQAVTTFSQTESPPLERGIT